MTRIGQMLRTYRSTQRMEQKDLAAEIGISPGQLSRLERGVGKPDGDQVLKIGQWMRQDVDPRPADLVSQAGEAVTA